MKVFLGGVLCLGFFTSSAQTATITTFTVDGWDNVTPIAINNQGQITGAVYSGGIAAGFVRDSNGQITVFSASNNKNTGPIGIDAAGNVSGFSSTCHDHHCFNKAFIRAWGGTLTYFQVDKGLYADTIPCCIKSDGWTAGTVVETVNGKSNEFGFLRKPSGRVIRVIVQHSTLTEVGGMNSSEVITGDYLDSKSQTREGFVRKPKGTLTTFGLGGVDLIPDDINTDGAITGYTSVVGQPYHGFVRDADGTIQTFDVPNATDGTIPYSIINDGTIAGNYFNGEVSSAFIRSADGGFTTFVPDGATDTHLSGMNQQGVAIGWYTDQTNHNVGFIRTP